MGEALREMKVRYLQLIGKTIEVDDIDKFDIPKPTSTNVREDQSSSDEDQNPAEKKKRKVDTIQSETKGISIVKASQRLTFPQEKKLTVDDTKRKDDLRKLIENKKAKKDAQLMPPPSILPSSTLQLTHPSSGPMDAS